jgi:hypothetical protein
VNLAACRNLDLGPETARWYRAVRLEHLHNAIKTAHTKDTRSRFSAGPDANPRFEILYLTETPIVAQFEIGALAGDPLVVGGILTAPGSFAIVHVEVVLQRVADLTLVSWQDLIETTVQELTGDWRGYHDRTTGRAPVREPVGTAPTQDLGQALFEVPGIEGFRTVSAKMPYHPNLVIFPEKMFKGSRLVFRDDRAGFLQEIDGPVPNTALSVGRIVPGAGLSNLV